MPDSPVQTIVDITAIKDRSISTAINTLAYIVEGGNATNGTYRYETPTTGSTINLTISDVIVVLNPATSIAALTIQLPVVSGMNKYITICSTKRIDALTITAGAGQTIAWTTNEMAEGGHINFRLISEIDQWIFA
jgi:hypothetical protein